MQDAYALFVNDELFIRQMNISPYERGTYYNHAPLRDRKLLLQKRELTKLQNKLTDKGLTIVPDVADSAPSVRVVIEPTAA